MVERVAELVKDKIINDISGIRDESDREGVRVVIELKKDSVYDVVLNQLYRLSPVQTNIHFNMLAIVYGRPEQLSLKRILSEFLRFREDVVKRRTRYELRKARERAHVLVGFATALANLDEIISIIRNSPDRSAAKQQLLEKNWKNDEIIPLLSLVDDPNDKDQGYYRLSTEQSDAILDLRLHRLTGLERKKLQDELFELSKTIKNLLDLLQSKEKILAMIKRELLNVKEKCSTPRRTIIEDGIAAFEDEDFIQREDMIITVSLEGYIKRVPLDTYRAQRRGGRGRTGMNTKEEDVVNDIIVANTHDNILFFSTFGKVYSLKTYQLPLAGPQSKGRAMINLFPLDDGEKISTVLVVSNTEDHSDKYLVFATSQGNVRRNRISDFAKIASNGKRAMRLENNELLIGVMIASEWDDIFLATAGGMANRFPVVGIRIFSGRDSNGVRAIRLAEGDIVTNLSIIKSNNITPEERDAYYRKASLLKAEQSDVQDVLWKEDEQKENDDERNDYDANESIISESTFEQSTDIKISDERFSELAQKEQFILTVTENGFGKRTSAYAYRATNRGTKGVSNIVMNKRNGNVVSSFPIQENDDVILVTNFGQLIRCPVKDIRITRRTAQGVIIFRISEGEKVVAVSRVINDSNAPNIISLDKSTEDVSDI
jgi:DNA gyrase subunit A